jgi:hypothetical protein
MRRAFPISIGFSGVLGNSLRFVPNLFREQVLKGLIVGKFDGAFLFEASRESLLSSSHSGDLPC